MTDFFSIKIFLIIIFDNYLQQKWILLDEYKKQNKKEVSMIWDDMLRYITFWNIAVKFLVVEVSPLKIYDVISEKSNISHVMALMIYVIWS